MIDIYSVGRVYFAAATLGAHSNAPPAGFRQKDVRFLLALFFNWVEPALDSHVHNTQVSRFMEGLVAQGFATRTRSKPQRYQLTRPGLIEIINRLTQIPAHAAPDQFFFVYYFLRNYGTRLSEMVEQKEHRLPRAFQVELKSLLDHEELLIRQIKAVTLEIEKFDGRIRDTQGAHDLAKDNTDKPVDEVIRLIEQHFPYDLHAVKPMSQLLGEFPPALRQHELIAGNRCRVGFLWKPQQELLKNYLSILKSFSRTT